MRPSVRRHLIQQLPARRFATYQAVCSSDQQALDLYLWNIEVSAAVTSTLGVVEIAMRNHFDQCLRRWNHSNSGTSNWIKNPCAPLSHIVAPTPPRGTRRRRSWVDRAQENMKDRNGVCTRTNPSHDDLVAALTFGTWVNLIPRLSTNQRNARVTIWNAAIDPYTGASSNVFYHWATELRYARNRASHLEPLLDEAELKKWHRYSARLMSAIDPTMASWVIGQAKIPRVLRRRP